MGGKGDATNLVDTRVAVVTNVSIDHVEYIGPTLDDIATEKAGIVKQFATLVLGDVEPELRDIFTGAMRHASSCAVRTSACARTRSRTVAGSSSCTRRTSDYRELFLSLHGAHQADNAAARDHRGRVLPRRAAVRGARGRSVRGTRARPAGSRSWATSRSCFSTARTTSPARTRCAPRSTRSSPPIRACSSSASCARRSRTRCSRRWARPTPSVLICTAPPSPRALDPQAVARPRAISAWTTTGSRW